MTGSKALQAALLLALGLAFVGADERPVQAGGSCVDEVRCGFKKPNFMFVLDYSSSMNEEHVAGQTNWEAAVEAIGNLVTTDGGQFDQHMHLALMRFGHDPDPASAATVGPGDLVDGQSLDVPWYEPAVEPQGWLECNGADITAALGAVGPPPCIPIGPSECGGSATWTNGALLRAREIIEQTRLDHPDDVAPGDERAYAIVLLTDGEWTGINGGAQTPDQDPAPTAGELWNVDEVPTFVIAIGSAQGAAFADEIAIAGGTAAAIHAGPGQLPDALVAIAIEVAASRTIPPDCAVGSTSGETESTVDDGSSSTSDPTTSGDTGRPGATGGADDTTGGADDTTGDDAGPESGGDEEPGGATLPGTASASTTGTHEGSGSDTDDPDTDDPGIEGLDRGCACASRPGATDHGWLALLPLLALRRLSRNRRRTRG